jgi:hypothetical protein
MNTSVDNHSMNTDDPSATRIQPEDVMEGFGSASYCGMNMREWAEHVNDNVSFKATRNGVYNALFYATCVITVSNTVSPADLIIFLKGQLDVSATLDEMHARLCVLYRKYKSHCLRVNRKGKAICEDRDYWYTLDYDCLEDQIKEQYLELVHAILAKAVDFMLAAGVNTMAIS